MCMYANLTAYLPLLPDDSLGVWVLDHENDGTAEHPFQMPFVIHSELVRQFISDVYRFHEEHEELELHRYSEILRRSGLQWDIRSMRGANVSELDGQCVMALIMGLLRAERFSEGVLLSFLKDGTVHRWLERLDALDNQTAK